MTEEEMNVEVAVEVLTIVAQRCTPEEYQKQLDYYADKYGRAVADAAHVRVQVS